MEEVKKVHEVKRIFHKGKVIEIYELEKITDMTEEEVKAVHEVKRIFHNGKIIELSRKT